MGHAMFGSSIKAVLAVGTGVVPPTLHAAPLTDQAASDPRVRLPRAPVALKGDGPHRAPVSAFGSPVSAGFSAGWVAGTPGGTRWSARVNSRIVPAGILI